MAAMHEQVHERASEEKQPRQEGHDVGPMLSDQEVPADGQEAYKNDVGAGRKETSFPFLSLVVMQMIIGHVFPLFCHKTAPEHAHGASEGVFAGLFRHQFHGDKLARWQITTAVHAPRTVSSASLPGSGWISAC
jgi:hypothetical protein